MLLHPAREKSDHPNSLNFGQIPMDHPAIAATLPLLATTLLWLTFRAWKTVNERRAAVRLRRDRNLR